MKTLLTSLFFLIIFEGCSFDNKSGIWRNNDNTAVKKVNVFNDFEKLYTEEENFNLLVNPELTLNINLSNPKKITEWNDEFYRASNNSENFFYTDTNNIIFKGKKLVSGKINEKFLFDGSNIILADNKGSLVIYSIEQNEIIYNFNFYNKKFKKIKKKLNFIVKDKIIYVSDNIGYLYALDYYNKKILWAKNFKIPFRSNLKITGNKIILADQDNTLYILDKRNGEKIKSLPTEQIVLKNNFENSISNNNKLIFFLNTYGSLYSIDSKNNRIEWFVNLNPSLNLNTSSLFNANPIILHQEKVIVSTYPYLYILDANNGSITLKKKINSIIKPIASGENLFLLTNDYLLVCINLNNGKIKYSININKKVAKFLDTKERLLSVKSLEILNGNLYFFLNNSFSVSFSPYGEIQSVTRFKSKINSYPIFVNGDILYINKKNQLVKYN
jgi:outer membrane protein assembly factor BamB